MENIPKKDDDQKIIIPDSLKVKEIIMDPEPKLQIDIGDGKTITYTVDSDTTKQLARYANTVANAVMNAVSTMKNNKWKYVPINVALSKCIYLNLELAYITDTITVNNIEQYELHIILSIKGVNYNLFKKPTTIYSSTIRLVPGADGYVEPITRFSIEPEEYWDGIVKYEVYPKITLTEAMKQTMDELNKTMDELNE